MLIAFSGAQSTGKSTLLRECQKLEIFSGYTFVEEVTRRLRAQQGIEINEASDNYDYTQSLITADHIRNCKYNNAILDRCALDGYVYTKYLFSINKVSKYILDFAESNLIYTGGMYDLIFYTDANIPLADDGVRSLNIEFRNQIVVEFTDAINKFRELNIVTLRGSVDERMNTIKKYFNAASNTAILK